jgi:hypothetical protein
VCSGAWDYEGATQAAQGEVHQDQTGQLLPSNRGVFKYVARQKRFFLLKVDSNSLLGPVSLKSTCDRVLSKVFECLTFFLFRKVKQCSKKKYKRLSQILKSLLTVQLILSLR